MNELASAPAPSIGTITADPNPGAAESGALTTLRWESDVPDAEIGVSEDGAPEQLFARYANHSVEIDWIPAGKSYLFRLYQSSSSRQLLKREPEVTKTVFSRIRALPDSTSIENDSVTTLQREITSPAVAEVTVSDRCGAERTVCCGTGGDVNYLFLDVLPRLQPGVLVHVHDIFLPFEYPQDWVLERHRFWTEQYLLQAFLSFNSEFEVLASSGYLNKNFPAKLEVVFPTAKPRLLFRNRSSASKLGRESSCQSDVRGSKSENCCRRQRTVEFRQWCVKNS